MTDSNETVRPQDPGPSAEKPEEKSLFWQLSWKVGLLCLLTGIIGCFFTDPLAWWLGVLLGGLFTVLRIKWMDLAIKKAVLGDPARASGIMTRQYFLRYAFSVGVLVLAAVVPQINLFSTMIAMFTLKLATFLQGLMEKPTPKDGSVRFEEWVDEEEQEEEPEEAWDRWETYNLKARKRLVRRNGKIERKPREAEPENELAAKPAAGSDDENNEQLSLFDE